jgi:hypothetical protein
MIGLLLVRIVQVVFIRNAPVARDTRDDARHKKRLYAGFRKIANENLRRVFVGASFLHEDWAGRFSQ